MADVSPPGRALGHVGIEDTRGATRRGNEPEQQANRRRLASSVRSQKPEDLTSLDAQCQRVEGENTPVSLGQLRSFDGRSDHVRPRLHFSAGGVIIVVTMTMITTAEKMPSSMMA